MLERLHYINRSYKPSRNDLVVKYFLEPNKVSFEKAAENIALESSIGTWTTISTMNLHIAKNLKPNVFELSKKTNTIKIAYPQELFEAGNIPQIMSSIGGNIFGMRILKNLKLLDISFPKKITILLQYRLVASYAHNVGKESSPFSFLFFEK